MSRGVVFIGNVGSGSLWRFKTAADIQRVFPGSHGTFKPGVWIAAVGLLLRLDPSTALGWLRIRSFEGKVDRALRGLARGFV